MATPLATQSPPAFEVASVKPADPSKIGRVRFLPGGRFLAENTPLEFVIQQVYGLRVFQLIAPPAFKPIIGSDRRYDIDGRGAESSTPEQLREMAKTLLADRFGLRMHKETRDLPIYALVLADGGVKGARAPDGKGGGMESVAPGWIKGFGATSRALVEALSRYVDRPVVDRTKLEEVVLDFDLTWTTLETPADTPGCHPTFQEMAKRSSRYALGATASCPSLFTAVREQLGLRLDAQLGPVEVLVIDAVQLPTEN
jgi:uncharacterized protein (TIGR03435 family)